MDPWYEADKTTGPWYEAGGKTKAEARLDSRVENDDWAPLQDFPSELFSLLMCKSVKLSVK